MFHAGAQGQARHPLCDRTASHVKKSIPILEAIQKGFNLSGSKKATNDMLFTVKTVSRAACLGGGD